MMEKIAPMLIWIFCAEDALVGIVYLFAGEWQKAVYWFAAAAICASVSK